MSPQLPDAVHGRSDSAIRWKIATIPSRAGVGVLALLALGVACDRNIEPYQPGEEPSAPDLARIFPGPPAGAGSTNDLSGNSRAPDRAAIPPSRAEGSERTASVTAPAIDGRIVLPDELVSARPSGGVLFVIARSQGVPGGPPLAVLRVADPEFPYSFSIGPANVMIPGLRFEGAISLSARLDADGNAMTRSPGDISSSTISSLAPGASGVTLVLTDRG